MNYPPLYPVQFGHVFQELKQDESEYFIEDNELPFLTKSDRLIFLSHFQAIGKMWEYSRKLSHRKEEQLKKKWDIQSIECEYEGPTIITLENGQYIETDTYGEVYDTDIPFNNDDDDDWYPKLAIDICLDYGKIWDEVEERIESFCNALGYDFEWDEYTIRFVGHGIKTEGRSAYSYDPDDLFENMEVQP